MDPNYNIDLALADKVAGHTSMSAWVAANRVAQYSMKAHPDYSSQARSLRSLGAVFMAGWIMGVRAEREKKREPHDKEE